MSFYMYNLYLTFLYLTLLRIMNKIKGILRGLIDLSLHKMSWCEGGGMLIRN
jgi:hypothetical protein